MAAVKLLLLLFASATCSGLNLSGVELELKLTKDPQCQFKGQQCSANLREIIYCTAKNGDSYIVQSCPTTRECGKDSEGKYACVRKDSQGSQSSHMFTCTGSGLYPDGYYCNRGYMCPSSGSLPELICECPNNMALTIIPRFGCTDDEEVKESCSCLYLDRCKDSQSPGSFGTSCHPGYYYKCDYNHTTGMETIVGKCPDGEMFIQGRCRRPDAPSAASAAAKPTVDPICEPYDPPCLPDPNMVCPGVGLYPHKVKRCYYECKADGRPVVRDCGRGSYFSCEFGQCGCRYKPKK